MQVALADVKIVRKRLATGEIREYRYHSKTKLPIVGAPGTAEFLASLIEASKGAPAEKPAKGLFAEVVGAYKTSPKYRNLSNGTKRNYGYLLKEIEARFGDTEIRAFNDRKMRGKILEWRDKMALTVPATAELCLTLLKVIVKFGDSRAMLDVNILAGVEKNRPSKSRASIIWTATEIGLILKSCANEVAWAVKLALLTGQRIGDLIRLKWSDIRSNVLCFTQQKTGAQMEIPIGKALARLLGEIPRRAETILTNTLCRPWCKDGSSLRSAWRAALTLAGLDKLGKHFHDLRGTAITCLADMGCTEAQIAAITGHSLEHVGKTLKAYLGRTGAQAKQAMARMDRGWIGKLETA